MRIARRHPRIATDVHDVHANLGASGRSPETSRVLNLSEGGMLIANRRLKVGQQTAFELSGRNFHYAGVAEVAHLNTESTGLRFLSWHDHDERPIRSLITQNPQWQVPRADGQPNTPVVRRVAVLTGPKRSRARAE
jgi:hypothetical protein